MLFERQYLSQLYDFSPDSLVEHENQGLYHHTFRFIRHDKAFILRISPQEDQNALLEQKMAYLFALYQAGCPVIEPILSVNQHLVETMTAADGSIRQITVTRQASGITHDLLYSDTLPCRLYSEIGRNLAILHDRSADLRKADFDFSFWQDSDNCFNAFSHKTFADQRIVRQYLAYRETCLARTKADKSHGIIHGDLHFSNIILDPVGNKVVFCDFDDTCLGPYLMDLAMILFDLGVILQSDRKSVVLSDIVSQIIDGYNRETMRDAVSLCEIHDFIKLLECSLYIQYYDEFMQSQAVKLTANPTGWLELFFDGRMERILENLPFLA